MLILSHYIFSHELKPLANQVSVEDVKVGARKVLNGLAIEIKSPGSFPGIKFYKIRIGSHHQARMIVFLVLENQDVVPILVRLKKDKVMGENMAMNNPQVRKQLNSNLEHVFVDIRNNGYQEIDLM